MSFRERRFNHGGRPRRSYVPLVLMLLYLVAIRLTIARKIAAVVLAMWKTESEYRIMN